MTPISLSRLRGLAQDAVINPTDGAVRSDAYLTLLESLDPTIVLGFVMLAEAAQSVLENYGWELSEWPEIKNMNDILTKFRP